MSLLRETRCLPFRIKHRDGAKASESWELKSSRMSVKNSLRNRNADSVDPCIVPQAVLHKQLFGGESALIWEMSAAHMRTVNGRQVPAHVHRVPLRPRDTAPAGRAGFNALSVQHAHKCQAASRGRKRVRGDEGRFLFACVSSPLLAPSSAFEAVPLLLSLPFQCTHEGPRRCF